jgi:hypothetical protein
VSPQHVVAGKPNWGLSQPSGTGAGVVWSFASLEAREEALEDLVLDRDVR